MSFCPVCGAHHDPKMPCADRAGELLRDAGIERKPMAKKELQRTVKKANRSLVILLIVVLSLFPLTIILSHLKSSHIDDRQSARAYITSGNEWRKNGDYDRAIADYNEAITSGALSKEELAISYYNRGSAWYDKEDYDKAIADYNEAIRINPQFAYAYYGRGSAWQNKGNYNNAIADYNEAIRIEPRYATAYENRGITRFNKGEFSSAASDLAQSQQLKPDIYTAIWLYLARARGNSDGKTELTLNTNGMDVKKWPASVVALYLGKADSNAVTSQAADPDLKKHKEQLCEADFFLGEWHLLRNGKQQARTFFTKAHNDCPKNSYQYWSTISELQRLK